ncbi:MAG: hypothetical protein FJW35_18060 [Acidobacteria bacterium]|nr:hypothetical protein [Acidobacteriota bacterium]
MVSRKVLVGSGVQFFQVAGSVNVFITGKVSTVSYTPTERTALQTAVAQGMNLVITSDDTNNDISSLFGITLDNAGGEISRVTLTDHPVFAGPFGRITRFRNAGESAHFRGWPTGAVVLASSSAGPTMVLIPRGTLSPGAGAVLAIAGVDTLSTFNRMTGPNDSDPDLAVTDALILNIVSHLCNPDIQATAPHLVFPQFANGESNVSYLNLTSTDKQSVQARVEFRDGNGAPFSVNIIGQGSSSTFQSVVLPNRTNVFMTDGVDTLKSGWASVRGSEALTGTIIFQVPGLGATGVGASEVAGGFVLPVVPMPVFDPSSGRVVSRDILTGLAVCNLTNKTTTLRLELWDQNGKRFDGVRFRTLPPYGHFARFLWQEDLYPNFDFRNFKGSLRIVSSNGLIAVTALQLGGGAGQFTALPAKALY